MKKRLVSVLLVACMAVSLVVGCGAKKETGGESSEDGVTTVKWMTSRPVDGEIDQVMREIADQYSKEQGGKWKIDQYRSRRFTIFMPFHRATIKNIL